MNEKQFNEPGEVWKWTRIIFFDICGHTATVVFIIRIVCRHIHWISEIS